MRVYTGIKEIYEKISEEEYNRINPYERMRANIKVMYPNAKIHHTKTIIEPFGSVLVPILAMYYDTQEVQ